MPPPVRETTTAFSAAGPPSGDGGPAVRAIHTAVAGRTRYKVPGLRRCDALKALLEVSLQESPHVQSASCNVLTGNILVFHDSGTSIHDLARSIERLVRDFATPPQDQQSPPSAEKLHRRQVRKQVVQAAEQQENPWHLLEAEKVAAVLQTSLATGLREEALPELTRRYGPNLLAASVPRSGLSILIGQFKSLPVVLLSASAAISLVTGGLADAIVILAVVGMNAVIGYLTESQAEMTIHSLARLVRPKAVAIRGGRSRELKGEEVLPGDLLVLHPGTYVAADSRIVASNHLTIDESALTGESLPVVKEPAPLREENLALGDRLNMAYMGTLVTGGQGLAVVVGTGKFSELGAVQAMAGEAQAPKTPMEKQLEKLGDQLALLSGAVCGAVFLMGLFRGYGMLQMLKTSVSLAVAAIPEGLPAVATTTLALGIRQMRMHKVLIRHLDAVETLGCVQTICLDKTGTLTFNRMSVVAVAAGMREYQVTDGVISATDGAAGAERSAELLHLIEICALCNESGIDRRREGYVFTGSSTENALLYLAVASGIDVGALRETCPLRKITHRSESRNYMITVHGIDAAEVFPSFGQEGGAEGRRLVAIKGSPIEVLEMCGWQLRDGERIRLTDEDRLAIELANERMAGASLRVLGAACCVRGSGRIDDNCPGFTWLGLVGMADPVRPQVRELIQGFHRAGIETLMITGDQVPTAYAIGKKLELSREMPLEIFDSTRLQEMPPELLTAFTRKVHVFARVSPAQKLQIVRALQRGGRVVAMTGDGINDSPALKAADIGIAMGTTGTDVAREVADVVLEDDDLETMLMAISQGRTIYGNIRKSVRFLLATNLTEIMLTSSAIGTGFGQPLTPMQLLWINLISDTFPALALAFEPAEPDVLARQPRDPQLPIVSNADLLRMAREGGIITAGAMGTYLYGFLRHGPGARASSLAFITLVWAQLLHAVSCRSETVAIFDRERIPPNHYLTWALLGSFAFQSSTLAVPKLRRLLGVGAITITDRLIAGAGAVLPLLANEAWKQVDNGRKP